LTSSFWSYVLYVDCLNDSGGADLVFTAPGYPSHTRHVDCFPSQLTVLRALSPTVGLWTTSQVTLLLGVASPLAGNMFGSVRPGSNPPQIQFASSRPEV